MKLVFFDFDVRSRDKCAEADFIQVKTGGRVFNESTNSNNSKKRMDSAGHFLFAEYSTYWVVGIFELLSAKKKERSRNRP